MEMGVWQWKRLKYEGFGRSMCVCGFDVFWRSNYFGKEPIRRTEVEVRVGKPKNGKAAGRKR